MIWNLSKKQKYLLISTSGGFLLWGIVSAIAPLAIYWSFMQNEPKFYVSFALIIGPIFLIIGNIILGIISDKIGRKKIFILTLFIYILGIIIIATSMNLQTLLLGLAISQFAVGGEEPPALALLSENFSSRKRTKTLTLIPNFVNIGSLIAALIFLLSFLSSEKSQRLSLIFITAVIFFILIYTRIQIPESYLWLKDKGNTKEAEEIKKDIFIEENGKKIKIPDLKISFIVLVLLGTSQYMSFWLMAIAIGPYIFPTLTNLIIFIASLGASIGAFFAIPILEMGKKKFTFLSFLGGFLTIMAIFILNSYLKNIIIFMPLLFINMIFSELAWVSRTNLEPEVFKTLRRTTMIGLVRVLPISLYIIALIVTVNFNIYQFILMNVILWLVGLLGSIIWIFKGVETKDVSIDYN